MTPRIDRLQKAIEQVHECKATHAGATIVIDLFRDKVAWDGVVEAFTLSGHPKAQTCYAWSYLDGTEIRYVTVLKIPPVDSAETAVKAAIASGQLTSPKV